MSYDRLADIKSHWADRAKMACKGFIEVGRAELDIDFLLAALSAKEKENERLGAALRTLGRNPDLKSETEDGVTCISHLAYEDLKEKGERMEKALEETRKLLSVMLGIREVEPVFFYKNAESLMVLVQEALTTPERSGTDKCTCGEPSPDRLVVHRTDGPCFLREQSLIKEIASPASQEGSEGICHKHGKVMLHDGPCSECRRENAKPERQVPELPVEGSEGGR